MFRPTDSILNRAVAVAQACASVKAKKQLLV